MAVGCDFYCFYKVNFDPLEAKEKIVQNNFFWHFWNQFIISFNKMHCPNQISQKKKLNHPIKGMFSLLKVPLFCFSKWLISGFVCIKKDCFKEFITCTESCCWQGRKRGIEREEEMKIQVLKSLIRIIVSRLF